MTDDSIPLCIGIAVCSILFIMLITLTITSLNAVSRSWVRNRLKEDSDDVKCRRLSRL